MDLPLKNSWLFPAIQSVHIIGIALLVGTIVIMDLGILRSGLRHNVSRIASQLAPWTRVGLAVMLVTGPILYAADAGRYYRNPAFRFKMGFLLVALIFHFTNHRRVITSDDMVLTPAQEKLVALISITLWTCVVLGGRAIADFDV